MNNKLKFLLIGDLHGEKPEILVNLDDVDAIIAPGDFCSDEIRPHINLMLKKRKETGNDDIDLDEFVSKKKREKFEKNSIKKGREILEFLNSLKKPVFIVPGNWDHTPYEDGRLCDVENFWETTLIKGLSNIHDVEFLQKEFKGIVFLGHGSTSAPEAIAQIPPEAFDSKEEFAEYVMRWKFFAHIIPKIENYFKRTKKPIIFISHNAPYNTRLDIINSPNNPAHKKHYGSVISRQLIDKYQPLLCVSGHIHEGYGKQRLKKTLCINAGYGGGVNTIVEIDVSKNKIIKVEFLGKNKNHLS